MPSPNVISRRTVLHALTFGLGAGLLAACGGSAAPPASQPASPATSTRPPSVASASTGPSASVAALASASAAAKPAGSASAGAQPKTGGMLRTVLSSDIASLDAHVFAGGAADTLWLIYERLTAYDLTLKPQPVLAESWDASTDFKKITFHIRKGVQFHSGREFTSDDVKYNLLRVRDPKVGAGLFVNQSN